MLKEKFMKFSHIFTFFAPFALFFGPQAHAFRPTKAKPKPVKAKEMSFEQFKCNLMLAADNFVKGEDQKALKKIISNLKKR